MSHDSSVRLFRYLGFGVLTLLPWTAGADPIAQAELIARADELVRESVPAILQGIGSEIDDTKLLEAKKLYEEASSLRGQAECHMLLGTIHARRETYDQAKYHYQESLKMWRRLGNGLGSWQALYGLAEASRFSGFNADALSAVEEAREILRELSDPEVPLDLESFRLAAIGQALPMANLETLPTLLPDLREILVGALLAMTEISQAETFTNLARFEDARRLLEKAQSAQREAQGLAGIFESKILNALGETYLAKGDHEQALTSFERSLEQARRTAGQVRTAVALSGIALQVPRDLLLDEASALKSIALAYQRMSRFDEALEKQRQALALSRQLANPSLTAQVISQMGTVYVYQGKYDRARDRFERSLEIAGKTGALDTEATALGNLAALATLDARFEEALRLQEEALEIFRAMGHRTQIAMLLIQAGETHTLLNRPRQALSRFEEARSIALEAGDPTMEQVALIRISAIYSREGELGEALKMARAALDRARSHDTPIAAEIFTAIGWILIHQGEIDEALRNLEEARDLSRDIGYPIGEANAALALGICYDRLHLNQEAVASLMRVLEIAKETGSETHEIVALCILALVFEGQGDRSAAIQAFEQAAAKVDSRRATLRVDDFALSYGAEVPVAVHTALANLYAQQGRSDESFRNAELSRSRAFLGRLGDPRISLTSTDEIDGRLLSLDRELRRIETDLDQLHRKGPEVWLEPIKSKLELLLDDTRRQYNETLADFQLHRAEKANLIHVDAPSLDRVRAELLESDMTLIVFFVTNPRTLAWVVDQETAHMVDLGIDGLTLEKKVKEFEETVTSRNPSRLSSTLLYQTLIAPLRPYIRHERLIIVPHGALHEVPFSALWSVTDQRCLIEEYSITYLPNVSILQFLKAKRSSNNERVLLLGNPDGTLPGAEEETKAIARLYGTKPFLGKEASESLFRSAGQNFDILQVAAHAEWNPRQPQFTRIALAPGGGYDGSLEVREILHDLDLSKVNLVVLSACNTARGERTGGDDLVDLTRSLLYAGSPSVIATLWKVDDAASRYLMETFHGWLRAGEPMTEALRLAQLAVRQREEWSAPYYWAGFGLHGDWLGVQPKSGKGLRP